MGNGGLHSASLVLAQTDFEQIERNQREGRWDLVGELLAEQGNKLKAAGADFFLLACNTVHTADDLIQSAVDLPFLHIVDPTARQVLDRECTDRGAARQSVHDVRQLLHGRLRERYGLRDLVAEGEHRENVHNALYAELAKGTFLPATREKFKAAISRTLSSAARRPGSRYAGFGMLIEARGGPVVCIEQTVAHAEAAVDMALQH